MKKPSDGLHALLALPAAYLLTKGLASLTGVLFFGKTGVYLAQMTMTLLAWGIWPMILKGWRGQNTAQRINNKKKAVWITAGALLGFPAQMGLGMLTTGWINWTGVEPGTSVPMPETALEWFLGLMALVILPALVEESFFRGMMLRGLTKPLGTAAVVAMTTVLFALSHGSAAALPANLLMGATAAILAIRGGLPASILFHLTYNLAAVLLTA